MPRPRIVNLARMTVSAWHIAAVRHMVASSLISEPIAVAMPLGHSFSFPTQVNDGPIRVVITLGVAALSQIMTNTAPTARKVRARRCTVAAESRRLTSGHDRQDCHDETEHKPEAANAHDDTGPEPDQHGCGVVVAFFGIFGAFAAIALLPLARFFRTSAFKMLRPHLVHAGIVHLILVRHVRIKLYLHFLLLGFSFILW